jgi:hypothetical protein
MEEKDLTLPPASPSGKEGFDLVAVGVVFAVLVFIIVVALQAFYYYTEREEAQAKIIAPANEQLLNLQNRQEALLHSYRVVDAQKKIIAIPIERAMDLLVEENKK